ncbi:MAG: response regulator transcription factor [Terriglobus sp.]
MRVVVAEDDSALSLFLKKALELDGHVVRQIFDGGSVVEKIEDDVPDMIVLDLGLPHLDGMDVLRALHDRIPALSVLVLTGRAQLAAKIECLNLGADDYLLKPFSMHELLARCRAIGRRRVGTSAGILQHGPLWMDRIQRLVTFGESQLEFTSKEFTLLEYLLLRKGHAVSRKELLKHVWQMSPEAGTNVVDVYVNYLRRKLGAVGATGIVETMRGEGYGIAANSVKPVASFRAFGAWGAA